MTIPCRWKDGGLGELAGRVRFLRRFGYPGRIDAHERIWLVFEGVAGRAEVTVNGQFLGRHDGDGPFEFEVTPLLQFRNKLVLELEAGPDGGIWGDVALEIRATAFLRDVRVWADSPATVHAAGLVVGAAERPLELYLLCDNATVAYGTVTPTPSGQSFELSAAMELAPGEHILRVDLVDGATIWYTVELPLSDGARQT